MAKDVDKIYDKYLNMMNKFFQICRDNYPSYLERKIQKAVELKRSGQFVKAIDVYLDIFLKEKKMFPAIMEFMYKAVLCTGHLDFAYEVIVYAEAFAKNAWGPRSWMGPWSQETKRLEFEDLLDKVHGLPTTFISSGDLTQSQINQMTQNLLKRNQLITDFISRYSGGAKIVLPMDIDEYINNCYMLYGEFVRAGIIK